MRPDTRWDIFCTVVDNIGDIGVCWRLARQLVQEYRADVRLWVDDLSVLQKLQPRAGSADVQYLEGVAVHRWREPFSPVTPADVVIEAFACELPANYVNAMAACPRAPLWLNLEYLSAEDWVGGCHRLPSPQQNGLCKYFFFPGWGIDTGGLLCDQGLSRERDRFQAKASSRFLTERGVAVADGALLVSLFCYENQAITSLLDAMATGNRQVLCLVPEGRAVAAVESYLGRALAVGESASAGSLTVHVIPFLSQPDYDRLLWSCDFNFVRGEDSFVRAQWAARPLAWHIYPQSGGAHWPKLTAFLNRYLAGLQEAEATAQERFWLAWNRGEACGASWRELESRLPALRVHARRWAEGLNPHGDLAKNLVQFYTDQL